MCHDRSPENEHVSSNGQVAELERNQLLHSVCLANFCWFPPRIRSSLISTQEYCSYSHPRYQRQCIGRVVLTFHREEETIKHVLVLSVPIRSKTYCQHFYAAIKIFSALKLGS